MLSGIFTKRKKIQELRAPSLQDIKRFRDVYARHADSRHVETPPCFEKSIYKAISCQKELHSIDFRQEDVTDPQVIALAETLLELPMISSLDLRDNRITDDGAKALLEVLRLQIITAKTPLKTDPKTKKVIPPPQVPEFTRYITSVNLKGNEISANVLQEMVQYTDILKREDKRLEIRAAMNQIDRNSSGGIDEEEFKAILKLLTGAEPSKKEVRQLMAQASASGDCFQTTIALENVLLAKCASSPSKKAACPPWEALVQVRHATLGSIIPAPSISMNGGAYLSSLASPQSYRLPSPANPSDTAVNREQSHIQISNGPGASERATVISKPSNSAAYPTVSQAPFNDKLTSVPPKSISSDPVMESLNPNIQTPPPAPVVGSAVGVDKRGSKPNVEIESYGDRSSRNSQDERTTSSGLPSMAKPSDKIDNHRQSTPASPRRADPDDFSLDLASWKDDALFTDDEEDTSHNGSGDTDEAAEEDRWNEASVVSRNSDGSSRNVTKVGSAQVSEREDERASPKKIAARSQDLTSLAVNEQEGSNRVTPEKNQMHNVQVPQVEDNDEAEEEAEQIDCVLVDIMKDNKPRSIAKLHHTEFKRGLPLQEFPEDVPFRNLATLVLAENGLSDLSLFKECRFPCVITLDLSKNRLPKVADDDLAGFPRLQVLDLSKNRLKSICGLGKLLNVKALNLSYNSIKTVINIEHLVQLQILNLKGNAISTITALRLLSLNKMLVNLDLDENPIIETDERQRRKLTVHILNIIPTLWTFGSVPVVGHNFKDKRKLVNLDSPLGKSLLDNDDHPELRALWVSTACDVLQIFQDRVVEPPRSDDDDPYGDPSGESSPTKQKKLSREQQRQKDEVRSRAVAYRSRAKAPPSPHRAKESPYSFGPPSAAPPRSVKKKKPVPNRDLAQKQLRRSSELSAPKFPPVDTTLLKQEQRRKSRPAFDVNMSVAERLQLAQDKAQRRTSTLTATGAHPQGQRKSVVATTARVEPALESWQHNAQPSCPRYHSPPRSNPVVEFRIDPLPAAPQSPPPIRCVNEQGAVNGPVQEDQSRADKLSAAKENNFLQTLAVTDFLNHAEEEFSTALTALNVLLSMSERDNPDFNKLKEYRSSLDALDILNEHESQTLYSRARCHDDPRRVEECRKAFDKLGVVKKGMKNLLKKLDDHDPGSGVIRAYCRALRTTELRDTIAVETRGESDSPVISSIANKDEEATTAFAVKPELAASAEIISSPPSPSLTSRLIQSHSKEESAFEEEEQVVPTTGDPFESKDIPPTDNADDDFDFLASDTSIFETEDDIHLPSDKDKPDENGAKSEERAFVTPEQASEEPAALEKPSIEEPDVISGGTTDITEDIQLDDTDYDLGGKLHEEMSPIEAEAPVDVEVTVVEGAAADDDVFDSELPDWETEQALEEDEAVAFNVEDPLANEDTTLEEVVDNVAEEFAVEEHQADQLKSEETEDSVEFEDLTEADQAVGEEATEGEDATEHVKETVEAEEGEEDEDDEEGEVFGDWEKGFDPNSNHYFWFNHSTGESQWTAPEGWPYPVDTPFEADGDYGTEETAEGEQQLEEEAEEYEVEENENAAIEQSSSRRSVSEAEDDIFSDHDLPDF
ncbi:hypothetical protein Poli38472_002305 [Pythium oligandrum]|uniref:Uncharacterized protein n=1 Tax=Pythium oligandrum TaxID=41045 RepID=A0A8K1CHW6_PYTOL|nr:hypothetical protein Poli38472_002305 [Pythium oligandrum]|eukprot:TMW63364.1 hypothetical protein Poli38472_002305 [Pythium oligandrum]